MCDGDYDLGYVDGCDSMRAENAKLLDLVRRHHAIRLLMPDADRYKDTEIFDDCCKALSQASSV